MGIYSMDLLQRFHSKVEIRNSGCHEWTGYINKKGYGMFRAGKKYLVHRFSYNLYKGLIINEIDHICNNRACVNPDHLQDITHIENIRRGGNTQKTHCPQGHEYNETNTRKIKTGRYCRICDKELHRRIGKTNETPTQYT